MSEAAASIEERIQFLEEQNSAIKRSGLLFVILVIVMGATMIYQSRAHATSVQTDGIIISNAGKPRGAVTAMPSGHLGMLFYNREGNLPPNVEFASIPYLDGFAIYDRNGRPRIMLGMDDQDNPVLAVVDPEGKVLFSAVPRAVPAENAPPSQPAASPTPATTATPQP